MQDRIRDAAEKAVQNALEEVAPIDQEDAEPIEQEDAPIEHETQFGGVYIKIAIDDFNAAGFAFGDSVDISLHAI